MLSSTPKWTRLLATLPDSLLLLCPAAQNILIVHFFMHQNQQGKIMKSPSAMDWCSLRKKLHNSRAKASILNSFWHFWVLKPANFWGNLVWFKSFFDLILHFLLNTFWFHLCANLLPFDLLNSRPPYTIFPWMLFFFQKNLEDLKGKSAENPLLTSVCIGSMNINSPVVYDYWVSWPKKSFPFTSIAAKQVACATKWTGQHLYLGRICSLLAKRGRDTRD